MSVDIRPCDIYDLKILIIFFFKWQTILLENNIKSISYKIDQYFFLVMSQLFYFKLH